MKELYSTAVDVFMSKLDGEFERLDLKDYTSTTYKIKALECR